MAGTGANLPRERAECRHADVVAAAIHADAERIKRGELEEALGKLDACSDLSDAQREVVERMADAIVGQLLAAPTTTISDTGDRSTLDAAVRLFGLEGAAATGETHEAESSRTEVPSDAD